MTPQWINTFMQWMERLVCPRDPESCIAPGRVSQGNVASGAKPRVILNLNRTSMNWIILLAISRPLPGARPGREAHQWVPGGWALAHGARPSTALKMTEWSCRPVSSPPPGKALGSRAVWVKLKVVAGGPLLIPDHVDRYNSGPLHFRYMISLAKIGIKVVQICSSLNITPHHIVYTKMAL